MQADDLARRRWRVDRHITAGLLSVWFVVTFGVAYFARELDRTWFGWPFSFWVGAQGALLVYLALVGVYAGWMRRRDDASREIGRHG